MPTLKKQIITLNTKLTKFAYIFVACLFGLTNNQNNKTMNTKQQNKLHIWLQYLITLILFATFVAVLAGCNVTRNVTTRSEFYQRGDTSVMIQTKTTETYDGTIKKY